MLGLGLGVDRSGFVPSALLDVYGGAAAAYSLRKLRNNYTGAAIRVRESATNTEADIGFTSSGELDTTALLAHTGANDGFVVTWYDQSGNARNAAQASAAAQPQIVSSGSVILENAKTAIRFNGSTYYLTVPSSTSTFNFMHNGTSSNMIAVARFGDGTNTSTAYMLVDNGGASSANVGFGFLGNDYRVGRTDGIQVNISRGVSGSVAASITENNRIVGGTQYLINFQADADNATAADRIKVGLNGGSLFGTNTETNTPTAVDATADLNIGRFSGNSLYMLGTVQELIFYPSDQSSNRTAIEANINAHYNIYP